MQTAIYAKELYHKVCARIHFCKESATSLVSNNANFVMLLLGLGTITFGLSEVSYAQAINVGSLNDSRIACVAGRILALTEGNFGALVMVGAGVATVISAAFGAFKAATSLLAVAVSAFVLRSLVYIFFSAQLGGANCDPGAGIIQGGASEGPGPVTNPGGIGTTPPPSGEF